MEFILSLVFIVVSIPALVVVLIWACVAGYTRVHRKGYTPPVTVSLLISSVLIGLIPAFFLAPRAVLENWPTVLMFSIFFWMPIAIAIAVIALLLHVSLPPPVATCASPASDGRVFFSSRSVHSSSQLASSSSASVSIQTTPSGTHSHSS